MYNYPLLSIPPQTIAEQLIRELPYTEQPAHRGAAIGFANLSLTELIALTLNLPDLSTAQHLLTTHPHLPNITMPELMHLKGVGPHRAAQFLASIELGRRLYLTTTTTYPRPQISCPSDAYHLLYTEMAPLQQEHFQVILLDTQAQVIDKATIYIGTVNSTLIRAAEVLLPAIRAQAPQIILAHNHPSGNPHPSPEDIQVTQQIVNAARLLDIMIVDHIIVGHPYPRFISLREQNRVQFNHQNQPTRATSVN